MDLNVLRSFIVVAESGTITDAAIRLHISQSALSRRLQQLEHELGAELLIRGRGGSELTAIGRFVATESTVILARFDNVARDIAEHLDLRRGTVRIGGGATVVSYLLPDTIAEFQRLHRGVRFHLKEAGSHEIASAVADGALDLGLVTLPVPTHGLLVDLLLVDDIVLVAAHGHPLAGHRQVAVTDLAGYPFVAFETGSAIRHLIDDELRRAGVECDVVMELRSIPTMLKMVATTQSLAFVSDLSLGTTPGLRPIKVRGLTMARDIGLATRHDMPLPAASAAFATLLRARAREARPSPRRNRRATGASADWPATDRRS
jgi:DNA-binding transcriptional LysR family regulator